jgi:molecular chaperone DnaK
MIPELQPERLQNLSQELQFAINTNNISSMEDHSQETRREIRNLPDEVQLVQGCILAIQQAKAVAPTEANAMSDKLSRMLNAAISSDSNEVDHLWRELKPDVQHWLNQELPNHSIITGLTR